MRKSCKKLLGVAVLGVLLGLVSGCSLGKSTTEIGFDISGPLGSLDPQYVESTSGKLVLSNVMEGLVIKTPEGKIIPGLAKEWEISEDETTYTFVLRENLYWEKTKDFEKLPITGSDFVFAFHRLFSEDNTLEKVSPYFSLNNGEDVFTKNKKVGELGVSSPQEDRVVFSLQHPDKQFLDKLALAQALPCNEEFFRTTKGRYGMGSNFLLANGPFTISYWVETDRVTLGKNPSYYNHKDVSLEIVYLFINREESFQRFEKGTTHILKVDTLTGEKLKAEGFTMFSFPDVVWSIGFQGKSEIWGIPYFRQALSYTVQREKLKKNLPQGYTVTTDFLQGSEESTQSYNPTLGKQVYASGLQVLGIDRVPTATIYTPNDFVYDEVLLPLQESWKEHLNLYISFRQLEKGTYESLLQGPNFELLLFPTPLSSNPQEMLSTFVTGNKANIFGYNNSLYNQIVGDISQQKNEEEVDIKAKQGENLLLSDVVIIPLYIQESYYVVNGFSGDVDFYPSEGIIRFHPATLPKP